MKRKILILTLFVYCSISAFSQIISGELKFLIIDSITHEYDFNDAKGISPSRDSSILALLYNRSDTTIQIINGNYDIKIINRFTDKDLYENDRDSSVVFFNQHYTISHDKYDVMKIADLNKKIATNYSVKNDTLFKICEFRMYGDFRETGEIFDLKIDKKDVKRIGGVEGYKIEYKEKFKNYTKIVKMYVCEEIKYPIKMLVNFPEEIKICPIYMEQYNANTPRNKRYIRLQGVREVPENIIEDKIKKIIRK